MCPTPLRVAIVFEYGTLNGGEQSMLAALDALPPGWIDPVALAPPRGRLAEALRRRHIRHVPWDLRDAAGARLPRKQAAEVLTRLVCKCGPHLVHANSLAMGRLVGAVAAELAVPTVAHLRDILKLSRAAVGDLNRNARLLAVSAATRDFHVAQGVQAERLRVLYNGVDCRRFQPRPPTGRLRTELSLPPDAFLVATIGQIGLRKGQDVLGAAAAMLGERFPQMHYLIVGERNSSKRESIEFEQQVVGRFAEARLAGRLHLLGYREDVPRLLNEVDLLVHPARQEPLGRVLLEAAAAGLPIIAADVGGTREIVEDGVSARLVPPGQPAEIAGAVAELYSDADLRRRLGCAARERVCARFDIAERAAELAAVWREIARLEA